jgi:hypothetical protein
MWNLHQPSKNSGLSEPHSEVQLAPRQQTEGLTQTSAVWHHDGQACCKCTLRNWTFATTMVHTNPVYDITLLGLVPQAVRCVGPGGRGALCNTESWSASRPTAFSSTAPECTCTHPSWPTWWLPPDGKEETFLLLAFWNIQLLLLSIIILCNSPRNFYSIVHYLFLFRKLASSCKYFQHCYSTLWLQTESPLRVMTLLRTIWSNDNHQYSVSPVSLKSEESWGVLVWMLKTMESRILQKLGSAIWKNGILLVLEKRHLLTYLTIFTDFSWSLMQVC